MDFISHLSIVWVVILLISLTCARACLSVAERNASPPRPRLRAAGEVLESLIVAMVMVFLVIRPFFLQAFFIPSESMVPTLTVDDRILVNKLSYRIGQPKRHEVVVFRAPRAALGGEFDGEEKDFVKRIVGLPGDTVEIHDGKVYVNGEADAVAEIKEQMAYDLPPYVVPKDKYFVMGDNRNHSNDSRFWGPLKRDRVIGKASLIFWPLSRIRLIR